MRFYKIFLICTIFFTISCKSKNKKNKVTKLALVEEENFIFKEEESLTGFWEKQYLPLKIHFSSDFDENDISLLTTITQDVDSIISLKLFTYTDDLILPLPPKDLVDCFDEENVGQKDCFSQNITIQYIDFPILEEDVLATTLISGILVDEQYILYQKGDIYFNNYHINFQHLPLDPLDVNNDNPYDLTSIMLHEIGHLLGLKHNTIDDRSFMYPILNSYSIKREIKEYDRKLIKVNYGEFGNSLNYEKYSNVKFLKNKLSNTEEVTHVFKLLTDQTCLHYVNSKLKSVHKLQDK